MVVLEAAAAEALAVVVAAATAVEHF